MTKRQATALMAVLIAARVVILIVSDDWPLTTYVAAADPTRYQQIATTRGTPYRDFAVEFPPLSTLLIEAVHGETAKDTAVRLAWTQFALDVLIAGGLVIGWGAEAGLAYLLFGSPLVLFLYFRIDLLSVALAVAGALLVRRGRVRAGAASLALGVMAKVWPLAIAPLLAFRRQRKALVWFAGFLAAAVALWLFWGGLDGPVQVATFRSARGWQIESLIGAVVWTTSASDVNLQGGSERVGEMPTWAGPILLLVMAVLVVLVWVRSSEHTDLPEGLPALTAVGVLLLLSPILSAQYLSWLLPWAAISDANGERMVGRLTLVATVATILPYALSLPIEARQGLVISRNAVLLLIVGVGLVKIFRPRLTTSPAAAA